jgi:hypothetical protein
VSATTIDPLLFEELVLGADFIGIVDCEQAGGIVARYRIIESWKGPRAGSEISIRVAVNYWEPQFPIALCGERYFVTAYKEAPWRVMSTTSGAPVPLWWRKIPADYQLPLFQGRQLLPAGADKSPEFDKQTRKAAQALLALKPPEQEAALLKAVVKADLLGKKWRDGEPDEAKTRELGERIAKLAAAGSIVDEVLRLAKASPEKWAVRARIVLRKAGRTTALERLGKLSADRSPWEKPELDELVKAIRQRCGLIEGDQPPKARSTEEEKPPTEASRMKLRKTLAAGDEAEGFGEAIEILTRYDPSPVAEYLVAWTNPAKTWRDADMGYVLGSYFAWRCGKDRQKCLSTLLLAKDPFIRVAGAVYLCFEDAEAGPAALKGLFALEGDPGVWAALTLARRGRKDAVPRALEVFRTPPEGQSNASGIAGVPHRNLQKRLLVLLSNAAHGGNVRQPVLPEEEKQQMSYLVKWWKQYGDKAILRDPWFKILESQKVD